MHDTFKQCPDEPIKSDEDLESFVVWLSSTYDNLAMTDYPNPAQFLSPLPAYPMKVCQVFFGSLLLKFLILLGGL